jgi:hypothetical protein
MPSPTINVLTPAQPDLYEKSYEEQLASRRAEPVECLGQTFPSDDARREHYLELLREKLKDPEFRKQPGFPIGEDDDILRLSDPPYYTACPNPFLGEFVEHYGTPDNGADHEYLSEPFAADVSEGRSEAIYTAHSYHTKVPPKAIARYILHYTKPGEIVLDAFSGSGMTGVASAMCADEKIARELGGVPGTRSAILCDLAPVATFIASTYLNPPDATLFSEAAENLLGTVEKELEDLWQVEDENGNYHPVEYQVWAEEMVCPLCLSPVASVNFIKTTQEIGTSKAFPCPHCNGLVSKAPSKNSQSTKLIRRLKSHMDAAVNEVTQVLSRTPLFAQVRIDGIRGQVGISGEARKILLAFDDKTPHWHPITPLINGERFKLKDCCGSYGIERVHNFYLPRQLRTFSALWNKAQQHGDFSTRKSLMFFIESNSLGMTVMNRYQPIQFGRTGGSQVNRTFSGTLYIPSMLSECAPRYVYGNKKKKLTKVFGLLGGFASKAHAITTQSSTSLSGIPDDSIDYVFVDPPFGRNLQYSELNQIWEAWLKVRTERDPEAIMDATRHREATEYTGLMRAAFDELFRVLKANRWMTVEFHNSSNVVWLAIQEAILSSGFVVADVRTLSKGGDTYKQSRQGLVKQDLVISAYKPAEALEKTFGIEAGSVAGAWAFIDEHLRHLPVYTLAEDGSINILAERQDYMLFDRMLAFHLQRNISVPMSAAEFYGSLGERYRKHDGMYFHVDQEDEYLKKRASADRVNQLELMPLDEFSTIHWLRRRLDKRPSTLQELHPDFTRLSSGWVKHEQYVELLDVLEENFLRYDGNGDVPNQIHAYLSSNFKDMRNKGKTDPELRRKGKDRWYVPDPSKLKDLEARREKQLLKEFDEYLASKEKRIKQPRHEVIRAGFKRAWGNRDFESIKAISGKIPEAVIQEDQRLLMWCDMAMTRLGDDAF